MNQPVTPSLAGPHGPIFGAGLSMPMKAGLVVLGTAVLAASSYIQVPMVPVPVTMQTLAVTMVGAVAGWRLGAVTVLAWLAEAALGLPVLAGGAAGISHFMGATGGYLLAFPIVAALVGWLVQRGWNGAHVAWAFAAMLLGNMLCLGLGAAWLSAFTGPIQAVALGIVPFLPGGVLKSALGAALLKALRRVAV